MAYYPEIPPDRKPEEGQERRRGPVWKAILLMAFSGLLVAYSLVRLIDYGGDWLASRETSRELAELAQEPDGTPEQEPEETAEAALPALPAETLSPVPPEETPSPVPSPAPGTEEPAEAGLLPKQPYSDEPYLLYTPRIAKLRKKAPDAVGWLEGADGFSETVVQRDNTYYLTHDARGRKNRNGALFLDEETDLSTRPYGYLIYGHNMKTGAMLGCLKNYENEHYYHENPFLEYDSLYEEGEYVIFAVGTVSTTDRRLGYVDLFALAGRETEARETALAGVKEASVFTCTLNVKTEDQLLLLVTCVDDDNDRRVLAARRFRPGETREALQKTVRESTRKIYRK